MAKARILIVEDESVIAKDIGIRLKGLGYAVSAIASSGEGAIQKAAETHPDLVLMDIVLKGEMDGIEAASQIRFRLNIPVLYLTAYADERTLQRAKITEPFAYIIKPFQERELHSNIEMALYKHKVERERKKTEEALRESEEKYRTILKSIEESYYEVDLAGNLTFFNDSTCNILGYSRDELMGMNNRQFMDQENATKVYETFNTVYTTGEPAKGSDWEITRKDGTKRYVEASVSLIKDAEGQPIGFRGIGGDISERRRAEEEKQKMEAQFQAAQRMEGMGTLARGIAHNFNNLLMGIQGNASLMLLDKTSDDPDYERLKSIEQGVRSGAELTKQLLGFARGGKYEVKPTDLNELIRRSSELFGSTKKEITIHTKYQEGVWPVEVDRGQIEQTLLNLYVNAWQAMPAGGALHLETENTTLDEDFTKPQGVEPGRYLKVSITDTGIGMDKKTQRRIFEPFFTTREMGRGTGLGLASVYGIISNHGGIITVDSRKGKGSTFTMYFPASEKELIEEEELLPGEVLRGTEAVLLVDDEEMVLEVAAEMLRELGYTVLMARSGKEAIEIISKGPNLSPVPDIVILDMIMPGMGGGETYDRLKEINPDIKVLLLSGYSIDGQATEILERGCNGFIQKPFSMRELSGRIREILNKE
jgi:two-component system cell cycle sensor histidine kinase/response regulator CckA